MFALVRLIEGLLVAHAVLGASFLFGSIIVPRARRTMDAAATMLRLVCSCAVGASAYGFVIFTLGILGQINRPALISTFLLPIVIIPMVRKRSIMTWGYWRGLLRDLTGAWNVAAVIVYVGMLIVAIPCVLPNVGGDAISYHLAYPQDWAHAGRLVVDPYLRVPFYASNFNLFFAALFIFGLANMVNFVCWAAALLLALAMVSASELLLRDVDSLAITRFISIAVTAAVVCSASFLQWLPTAYVDVPIAAFSCLAILCFYLALLESDAFWIANAAIVAGFTIGMKYSFIVLVPAFIIAIIGISRRLRAGKVHLVAAVAALLIVAAPWYVRNLVLAGDPIAPILNFAIYGSDGIYTKDEWSTVQQDLSTEKTVRAFVTLPVRAFFHPGSNDFRGDASNALILLLYVPMIILLARYAMGRRSGPAAWLFIFFLVTFLVYWFATATRLRYGLLIYPVLGLSLVAAFEPILRAGTQNFHLRRIALPAAVLGSLSLLIPSDGGWPFYEKLYHEKYKSVFSSYVGDDAYLRLMAPGYAEEQFAARVLRDRNVDGPVYVLGNAAPYFFRRDGIVSIGDWVGPGGFFRLAYAIDDTKAVSYLNGLGVNALIIEPDVGPILPQGYGVPLERQLLRSGFCKTEIPATTSAIYLRNGRPCNA